MKERFKVVPAVFVLLVKDMKILMIRRFNTGWQDGNYTLPSGHFDGDETATQVAIRETLEETGVKVLPGKMEFVHAMHRSKKDGDAERVDFYFKAKSWEGEPQIMEPDRCDDTKWFGLDSLPANTVPCVRHALKKIQEGIFYSEFGW